MAGVDLHTEVETTRPDGAADAESRRPAAARAPENRLVDRDALIRIGWMVSVGYALYVLVFALQNVQVDVQVFQDAGWAMRRGGPIYDGLESRSGLQFIYPPVAALLFVPLTLPSSEVLQVLWTVALLAALWGILAAVCIRLDLPRPRALALALVGFAIALEPVRANFEYAQINLFLVLLVTLDVLGFLPRWARGWGVGIAAGIKITPAAFGLLFLVRRDWRSLLGSVGAFAVTVAVGFLARPSDSHLFWTKKFFDSDRAGEKAYEANLAVTGWLARADLGAETVNNWWKVVFVLFAVAAAVTAWWFERAGEPVVALAAVALAAGLGSPIAVTHHWPLIALAVPLLLVARYEKFQLVVGIFVAVQIAGAYRFAKSEADGTARELLRFVVSNSQGFAALGAFLVLFGVAVWGFRRAAGRFVMTVWRRCRVRGRRPGRRRQAYPAV